jgi:uncharacterized hydrophobic protein (TIGR00271 family)
MPTPHDLARAIAAAQDRLAAVVGCPPAARDEIIAEMSRRDPRESTAYWLQLVVAVGIATLGLVLGSTAVIIGAMLIAPLMGPIVGLGMGLAVGSPLLVLRAVARIVASVVVAIGMSALLTTLLPFHEVNAEIAARTAPTLLDLVTAAFCALAGAYAAMRPSSDVASTAAGTAIGISLVPPLCASGFGIGTGLATVASGAALLFLANFVAIVAVGMVAFVAVGFNQVDTLAREEAGQGGGLSRGASRWLAHAFVSRGGPWLRGLMPLVLLAVVYVPLRDALDEVAWQIRARRQVERAVAALPHRVVQSRIHVERGVIDLALVLLGSHRDAGAARDALGVALREVARREPRVEVFAVPDATAFAGLEAALRPAPPPLARSPAEQLADAQARVREALERRWPRAGAGPLLEVTIGAGEHAPRVALAHLGPALDATARELLRRSLADDLGREPDLELTALPAGELGALDDAELSAVADAARRLPRLAVCIFAPPRTVLDGFGLRSAAARRVDGLHAALADHPGLRVASGAAWSARLADGDCPPLPDPLPELGSARGEQPMTMTKLKSIVVAAIFGLAAPATAFAGGGKGDHAAKWQEKDTDGDGKISASEHDAAAKKKFETMDSNKDSRVTAEEMTAVHAGKKAKAGDMSAADKIKAMDKDGDGALTAEEHATAARDKFGALDGDKDGFLSKAEFEAGHKMMKKDTAKAGSEGKTTTK